MLDWLFKRKPSQPEQDVVRLAGNGQYDCDVVGESNYQDALESIAGPRAKGPVKLDVEARLLLDDKNPHDNQAVRVEIEGKTVGFLKREVARVYRSELRANKHPRATGVCKARIIGGGVKRGELYHFGVVLDIPVVIED